MPHKEDLTQASEQNAPLMSQNTEANPLVSESADLIEKQVSEVAPNLSTKANGQNSSQSQTQQKKTDDDQGTERDLLRARLLKQAPKPTAMRAEVKKILEKEKVQLEGDIEKYRKKKQYHLLSASIMKLRMVVRQIEDLARASLDQVKDLWLKVIHKFA